MRIIFFGTPDFVIPVVLQLYKTYGEDLIAVVTRSPKQSGRDKKISRSDVDNWAYKHKIPVIYGLDKIPAADLGIVASFGLIIPQEVINKFSNGILNIHPSLLPKYRGASPIQFQIADGAVQTGVSVIKMDEKMDHGPIVSQFKDTVQVQDTNETLRIRLFERSAKFLIDLIPNYLSGKIKLKPQNHEQATFTKIITRQNGFVADPFEDPTKTDRLYKAMQPWPGVWTLLRLSAMEGHAKRLKILKLHLEDKKLILDEVQIEGKTPVTWDQFKKGYPGYKLA